MTNEEIIAGLSRLLDGEAPTAWGEDEALRAAIARLTPAPGAHSIPRMGPRDAMPFAAITAERDRLAAQVARVEALLARWDREDAGYDVCHGCREDVRFALDGDAKEGTEERVEVDVEVKECELVSRDLAALTPTEDKP